MILNNIQPLTMDKISEKDSPYYLSCEISFVSTDNKSFTGHRNRFVSIGFHVLSYGAANRGTPHIRTQMRYDRIPYLHCQQSQRKDYENEAPPKLESWCHFESDSSFLLEVEDGYVDFYHFLALRLESSGHSAMLGVGLLTRCFQR